MSLLPVKVMVFVLLMSLVSVQSMLLLAKKAQVTTQSYFWSSAHVAVAVM